MLSTFCFGQKWSISFAERAALLSIYHNTDGENWSTKWDAEKDPKFWYGVKINNGRVSELNLRGNSLKGNFPNSVARLSKLEKLDLSSNQLSGEVSGSLSGLSSLTRLDLSYNNFSGDPSAVIIPLSALSEISIGNNNFIFADINGFIQNFPNLKILDLAHTQLTSIPQQLSNLHFLESLDLSNNSITQNFDRLSTITSLRELSLAGNQLTKVPTELLPLTQLKSLNLNRNAISQFFTSTLSSLKNLEWLSLQGNNFTAFPTELAQLKKIIHLNFSNNMITGGFEIIAQLPQLEQIFLDNNTISGTVPTSFLQLKNLQMLSLNGNELSGEIPENIPPITFLDNNRFTKNDLKNFLVKGISLISFTYTPQRYDEQQSIAASSGSNATLPQSLLGSDYQLTWFKDLDKNTATHTEQYYLTNIKEEDFTNYTCEAYFFDVLPKELLEVSFYREPVTLTKGLGTEEVKSDLAVYPNPAKDFIYIRSSNLKINQIYIFDLSGKLLLTTLTPTKSIQIDHLPSGVYIISIKSNDEIKSFKFIKE